MVKTDNPSQNSLSMKNEEGRVGCFISSLVADFFHDYSCFLFEYLPFFVLHVIEHIKITLFDIILKNLCPFVKSKYIWLKGQEVTRGETDFIVTLFQAVKIVIQKRFNC